MAGVTDKNRSTRIPSNSRNAPAKLIGRGFEPCGLCGVVPPPGEPIYPLGWYKSLFGDWEARAMMWKTIDDGIRCIRCLGAERRDNKMWVVPSTVDPWPLFTYLEGHCGTCSRPVLKKSERVREHFFCSHFCEYTYYNRRRTTPRQAKVCEVCEHEFTATRSDQKTCSAACRQKAYRQRKKVAD